MIAYIEHREIFGGVYACVLGKSKARIKFTLLGAFEIHTYFTGAGKRKQIAVYGDGSQGICIRTGAPVGSLGAAIECIGIFINVIAGKCVEVVFIERHVLGCGGVFEGVRFIFYL